MGKTKKLVLGVCTSGSMRHCNLDFNLGIVPVLFLRHQKSRQLGTSNFTGFSPAEFFRFSERKSSCA